MIERGEGQGGMPEGVDVVHICEAGMDEGGGPVPVCAQEHVGLFGYLNDVAVNPGITPRRLLLPCHGCLLGKGWCRIRVTTPPVFCPRAVGLAHDKKHGTCHPVNRLNSLLLLFTIL